MVKSESGVNNKAPERRMLVVDSTSLTRSHHSSLLSGNHVNTTAIITKRCKERDVRCQGRCSGCVLNEIGEYIKYNWFLQCHLYEILLLLFRFLKEMFVHKVNGDRFSDMWIGLKEQM